MRYSLLSALCILLYACGSAPSQTEEQVLTDANTPLHLLQPDYQVPYGDLSIEDIKTDLDRVLAYLEAATPMQVVNKTTGETITDYTTIDADAQVHRGDFRLTSYEWGVTYSAMLAAGAATGDEAYTRYATERLRFLAELAPYFQKLLDENGTVDDAQMTQVVNPHALDDAGAVCASMIKALGVDPSLPLNDCISRYIDYIMNKEYRLADGTFARLRPHYNTIWLDDMFMGIPPVAHYATLAGADAGRYYQEAVRQVLQFAQRMWVPEKRLFRHGWVEAMTDHPAFHWARANGWALLTMTEVLDVLPADYPQRDKILALFQDHVRGLTALQSGEGFWHQLLDRNDSYLETSATAIYTYCIAHAINQGWLDALAYGPVVQLGWHAVSTQINDKGQVEGTCVGTGMGFDPAFYYYRPVNCYAAHGYGPVIYAGAEVIKLLKEQHPKMNDSAVMYYATEQATDEPIFSVSAR